MCKTVVRSALPFFFFFFFFFFAWHTCHCNTTGGAKLYREANKQVKKKRGHEKAKETWIEEHWQGSALTLL